MAAKNGEGGKGSSERKKKSWAAKKERASSHPFRELASFSRTLPPPRSSSSHLCRLPLAAAASHLSRAPPPRISSAPSAEASFPAAALDSICRREREVWQPPHTRTAPRLLFAPPCSLLLPAHLRRSSS
ncbi:hypothetical protein VPH35_118061 [Triticum aestivum]